MTASMAMQGEETEGTRSEGSGNATARNGRNGPTTRAARDGRPTPRAGSRAVRSTSAREATERELLVEISSKLDRLVAVMATQGRDRDTQVAILKAAGCDSSFVASLVGMTPGAVRNLPAWRGTQSEGARAGSEEGAR